MNYVLSAEEMREIDKKCAYDYFIPTVILMEYAGMAVLSEIRKTFLPNSKISIIVGSGNNGGDGLALARQLYQLDYDVKIYLITELDNLTPDATLNYNIIHSLGIECEIIYKVEKRIRKEWSESDLLVDAILGTGCNRDVTGIYYECIDIINQLIVPVYSIDIPSGLNGNTGLPMPIAVRATKTVVLAAYKRGNLLAEARLYHGEIVLADIGIPKIAYENMGFNLFCLERTTTFHYPKSNPLVNKGTKGKVLIIGGSEKMGGALILSAEAAYRSGAGLVYAYTTENNYAPVLSRLPELLINTYSKTNESSFKIDFPKEIDGKNAVLIGPGLSASEQARELLELSLSSKMPLVIDADGLNLLAKHQKLMALCVQRAELKILTPHLKEMERLTGLPINQLANDMVNLARHYAKHWNAVLVLKNHRTVIAFPDGKCYINILGNEGMATGGSGDVLSGYLAGLIAGVDSKNDYEQAILYGVYHHSLAGDLAAKDKGKNAMLASDIIAKL